LKHPQPGIGNCALEDDSMNPLVRFVKRHQWITAAILLFIAMAIADFAPPA
jgi:hypothetical protein